MSYCNNILDCTWLERRSLKVWCIKMVMKAVVIWHLEKVLGENVDVIERFWKLGIGVRWKLVDQMMLDQMINEVLQSTVHLDLGFEEQLTLVWWLRLPCHQVYYLIMVQSSEALHGLVFVNPCIQVTVTGGSDSFVGPHHIIPIHGWRMLHSECQRWEAGCW